MVQFFQKLKRLMRKAWNISKDKPHIHRTLKLDQVKTPETKETISHAVFTEDGKTTRDVVLLEEDGAESSIQP